MDTADYHLLIAALLREADTASHQAALLRQHAIGDGWQGRVRAEAEIALGVSIDTIERARRTLGQVADDVARAWRESLTSKSLLG